MASLSSNHFDHSLTLKRTYPFEKYIINVHNDSSTANQLVSWQFPNGHIVQLVFFTDGKAELFSLSPSLILPEEGENGTFYTDQEIELFLSHVKRAEKN
ncbi:hypothetical protein AM501_11245 [Aneurinibacillus migulanus]|uniref:Uncharacterized protein n=1 Tax=Aneurinibacillus migulanus TaxID=47500 RepID=A0A0D1XX52_ANEMI|nr:hypothetical protein [Aneurinibacillus migulanus]KIV53842.1 hypothetical protein TS64_18190 [Aneurinibacillus migulanus]KIV58796.1 hypothetical protein TS65_05405 [Aneurinibacillus migulanus]KON96487.1 hypothetical protein AF333_14395 [Aneurinibacillus migulanus]KPD08191.1 hypothetical protein AM501_11245 [Aneurinibacillus migulanus]MCP1357079.1 hypothetical protein [Aneurinibacillus migulanus]